MSTIILKGAGAHFRVTSNKPANITMVTSKGTKTIQVNEKTEVKFANAA